MSAGDVAALECDTTYRPIKVIA